MICIETSLPAAEIPRRLLRDRKRRKLQHAAAKLPRPPPKQVAAGLSTTISATTPLPMILTSDGGATWRVRTLFSLRALRSLLVLLKGILLLLLLPFRRRAIAVCGREAGARRRGMAIGRVGVEEGGDGERSVRGFELLETDRGDTIFTQSWASVAVRTKGLLVLLHGLNEHSGRYNQFARLLNESGLKVYAMDWIGHGGSDGLHGYVHSLDYAVNDLITFLDKVLAENPGLPCFCFGHSTGGAIVLKAVMDPKIEACVQGVVLTSPAIHVEPSHPIVAAVAPIFSLLIPRYQFTAVHKKGPPVSRDPEALKAKYSDPLVFTGAIRVRTGYEILRISYQLQQNLCRVTVPFLVLHGTADTVTDPLGSTMLYQAAASPDKSIKLYDGLLHDLLFEPEKEEITHCIIEWLVSRLEASR